MVQTSVVMMELRPGGGLELLPESTHPSDRAGLQRRRGGGRLTCHAEAEHLHLVAQSVADVDPVQPRVCGRHADQEEGPGGGVALQAPRQPGQDHGCWWRADGLAADGDVLALRDHRRREDEDGGVPGWSWTTRRRQL